jgi:hypothetical protein
LKVTITIYYKYAYFVNHSLHYSFVHLHNTLICSTAANV